MTLEDAMRLVVARGALMHQMPSGGSMAAIFASESAVRALIDKVAPEIAVAAMNGPLNTVASGDRSTLRMLLDELNRQRISYRELHVSNAFHSPLTESILDDLQNVASQITYHPPKVSLVSNVTGELMLVAPDEIYWRRHLREAVRFGDGMLALAELGCRSFLEIGPHPVLLPIAQACLGARARSTNWVATLNRQKPDCRFDYRNARRALSRRPQYKLGSSACQLLMASDPVAHVSLPAQALLAGGQCDP